MDWASIGLLAPRYSFTSTTNATGSAWKRMASWAAHGFPGLVEAINRTNIPIADLFIFKKKSNPIYNGLPF
ncbi:MAG TPA: hypothetical protein DC042_12020 [Bacteroidales bacterium]|nr:hypothetical protein [Bacteroidales bacterium]